MSKEKPFDKPTLSEGECHGIRWVVLQAPFCLTGYVRLPEHHPWRNADMQAGEGAAMVHGGVTYGPDIDGWIGFDTAHYGDEISLNFGQPLIIQDGHRWTETEVAEECKRLCEQVAATMKEQS